MKILCIALLGALSVTASLADTNINSYGNGGVDRLVSGSQQQGQAHHGAKSGKTLRDHDSFSGFRDRFAQHGNKYNGFANDFGQADAKGSESGKHANQAFKQQDSKFDEIARDIAETSRLHGYKSASEGKYDKVDDNRAKGHKSAAAKKNAYNRGKVFNDNISYGFDKKFDLDLSERGGFEEENGHNRHKVDEFREKQKARKLKKGDHTAANARQDAQRALKENKFSQNAAQKKAANAKFGNNDKKLDKVGSTQDAQAVQFDRKDSKFTAEDKGHQQAVNKANQFANKDNAFGRKAALNRDGAQGHGDKKYYGEQGGKGVGHGGLHGGLNGVGGAHAHANGGQFNNKYGEHANQLDAGKEHLAQDAGKSKTDLKEYDQKKSKQDFAQLKSLKDQRNGKFAHGVHNAEKNGFNAKNSAATKTANGGDRKYADAAAKSNAKAAKHDLDEELFDKENFKRRQQDDNETFKKLKRFYHDKKSGGNNFERLKYNRKKVQNDFGSAQEAKQEKQNQFQNAHKSAKHNAASRGENYHDAKASNRGYSLNNAHKASASASKANDHNFAKAAQKSQGHKKQISESDVNNKKDSLSKKGKTLYDKSLDASAVSAEDFKKSAAQQRDAKGNVLGGSSLTNQIGVGLGAPGLGTSSAHKDIGSGIHAGVAAELSDDHSLHNDDKHQTNFGKLGGFDHDDHHITPVKPHRRLGTVGSHGSSGYSDHSDHASAPQYGNSHHNTGTGRIGGTFGKGSFGSFGSGLFGSFGFNKGRSMFGHSAFGGNHGHSSKSSGQYSGGIGLFRPSVGTSFGKSAPFGSSFGSRSGFGFGSGSFKGPLF